MEKINFDAKEHIYTDSFGKVIPSVSTILKSVGFGPQNGFKNKAMAVAADRGTEVHDIFSNYLLYGTECENEALAGYFKAFMKFTHKHKVLTENTEYQVFNELFGVKIAGTVDFKGEIDGKRVIIDYKTTKAIEKYHAYQIEMYAALDDNHIDECYILQVMPDGNYVFMRSDVIAPGCKEAVQKIVTSYVLETKFEDHMVLESSKELEEYVSLKEQQDMLKKKIEVIEKKIKARVTTGSAKSERIEVTYRKPAVKIVFNEDEFENKFEDNETYTGSEVKSIFSDLHEVEISDAGTYSIKVLPVKKDE